MNIVCDQGWIPVPTTCESGFGLYDEVSEAFVGDRASATTCRACLPGMFSKAVDFKDVGRCRDLCWVIDSMMDFQAFSIVLSLLPCFHARPTKLHRHANMYKECLSNL